MIICISLIEDYISLHVSKCTFCLTLAMVVISEYVSSKTVQSKKYFFTLPDGRQLVGDLFCRTNMSLISFSHFFLILHRGLKSFCRVYIVLKAEQDLYLALNLRQLL